jgi:Fe-S-cluster containining protein
MLVRGRNSLCFCNSGLKTKKCHSDIHNESKLAELIKTNILIDKKVENYINEYGQNTPCAPGCSSCCYDDFSISLVEMTLILYEVNKNWSKEKIEELFTISKQYLEEYKNDKPDMFRLLELDANKVPSAAIDQITKADGRNKFPCVFLNNETGKCKVYHVRPFICRTTGNAHAIENPNIDATVCEYISSFNKLNQITPDISSEHIFLEEEIFNYTKLVFVRKYPMFYWMKIFYNKNNQIPLIKLFQEDIIFATYTQANNKVLKDLNLK